MATDYLLPAGAQYVQGSAHFVPGTGTANVLEGARVWQEGGMLRVVLPARVENGSRYTPPSVEFQLRVVAARGSRLSLRLAQVRVLANALLLGDQRTECNPNPRSYVLATTLVAPARPPDRNDGEALGGRAGGYATRSSVRLGAARRGPSFRFRRTGSTTIGHARVLQPPLDHERRLVVEDARDERVLVEDELTGDEEALRVLLDQLRRDLLGLDGDLDARRERAARPGSPSHAAYRTYLSSAVLRPSLELVHLADALEDARVDDRDRAEDDALEVPREHAQEGEQRVPPEAAVAADEEDRHRLLAIDASTRPMPPRGWRRSASGRCARPASGSGSSTSSRRMARDDAVVVALDRRSRARTRSPVTTSVSQPPTANFSTLVTMRIVTHSARPTRWTGRCWNQSACSLRCWIQKRAIPRFESENVRNTLIEYMTTSFSTSPCV